MLITLILISIIVVCDILLFILVIVLLPLFLISRCRRPTTDLGLVIIFIITHPLSVALHETTHEQVLLHYA